MTQTDIARPNIPPVVDGEREARCVPLSGVEVRANEDGSVTVAGYAAVYDSPSEDLGGFVEELKQGAFRKVLRSKPDVRFLVNHEGVPLGRTAAGTLRLKDDPRGLAFECDFPDTGGARDLAVSIERGDISQCSFMFCVTPEGREWFFPDDQDEPARRVIYEISELLDVSVVTFPAYPATEIGVRGVIGGEAIASADGRLNPELFTRVCERVHGGDLEVSLAERRELDRAAERLGTLTPWQRDRLTRREEAPEEPEVEVEPEAREVDEGTMPDTEVESDRAAEPEPDAEEREAPSVDLRRRRLRLKERDLTA